MLNKKTYVMNLNNVSPTAIQSVNNTQRHMCIIVISAIDIVCILAATPVIEALGVIIVDVIVPQFNVITVPPTIPRLIIEKWISNGGWRPAFVSALSLNLAWLQHQEIKRIIARVSKLPHPDVIIFI